MSSNEFHNSTVSLQSTRLTLSLVNNSLKIDELRSDLFEEYFYVTSFSMLEQLLRKRRITFFIFGHFLSTDSSAGLLNIIAETITEECEQCLSLSRAIYDKHCSHSSVIVSAIIFNRPALESVLKKCSNIRKIILDILSNCSKFEKLVPYNHSSIRSGLNSSIFNELFTKLTLVV